MPIVCQSGRKKNASLATKIGRKRTRFPGPLVLVRSNLPSRPPWLMLRLLGLKLSKSECRAAAQIFQASRKQTHAKTAARYQCKQLLPAQQQPPGVGGAPGAWAATLFPNPSSSDLLYSSTIANHSSDSRWAHHLLFKKGYATKYSTRHRTAARFQMSFVQVAQNDSYIFGPRSIRHCFAIGRQLF